MSKDSRVDISIINLLLSDQHLLAFILTAAVQYLPCTSLSAAPPSLYSRVDRKRRMQLTPPTLKGYSCPQIYQSDCSPDRDPKAASSLANVLMYQRYVVHPNCGRASGTKLLVRCLDMQDQT